MVGLPLPRAGEITQVWLRTTSDVPHISPSDHCKALPYSPSSARSQIAWLCPVIRGLSWSKLSLFNRNIPSTSFLQACIPRLPFKISLSWQIPHPAPFLTPLNLKCFSQKAARVLSSGRTRSTWEGRGAGCPESEVLDEHQQLASLASVLSQRLSVL